MDILDEVLLAEKRIRPHVRKTVLERSPYLSQVGGANIYCKLENFQYTGSFKVRGAMNKLLSLTASQLERGVVAASTGNHGAAVAWSASRLRAPSVIWVPEGADDSKVEAIENLGGVVRYFGGDCGATETHARDYAIRAGMAYVSPYNDPQIIAGQGTIGVEMVEDLGEIDAVFASLGGGGLISGIAAHVKSVLPRIEVIGCSPENSQVMIQSVRAGRILDLPSLPTLSDATAGGVEAGSITFDLCRRLVDDYMTVSESEIADALRLFISKHHMLVEGAAAVAVASYLKMKDRFRGKNVVIVICGANISASTLKQVL